MFTFNVAWEEAAPEEGYGDLWVDESQEGLHHTKLKFNGWSGLREIPQGETCMT